jgi:uncharacterized protein YsxB (DUF464 family)
VIRVSYRVSDGESYVRVEGHAAENVCAAVSMAIQMIVLGLVALAGKHRDELEVVSE